jgi:phosphoserine phosphatase
MKIVLVRHGHVSGIVPERFRGRANLALTDLGREQARLSATRIASAWRPSAIYTSPMCRAVDTGEAIAARLGLQGQVHTDLNDIDYGAWQGLTPDEARAQFGAEVDLWYRAPHLARIRGGESLADVLVRATRLVRELEDAHRDETIVLVGHDSVNRVLLTLCLELPLAHYWRLRQDPCAISEIDGSFGRLAVLSINETHHLQLAAA